METQNIIEYINAQAETHLQKARNRGYVCPICGNGTGESGTGLVSPDNGKHWKCFKCGFYGDYVDLVATVNGFNTNAADTVRKVAEVLGLNTSKPLPLPRHEHRQTETQEEKPAADYSEYIARCCADGCNLSYLQARGISEETARKLKFGYDPKENAIIAPYTAPNGAVGYMLRWVNATKENGQTRSNNRGKVGLFNSEALQQLSPVFITEGAIDAASIVEVGGQAVALNSADNARMFLNWIDANDYACRGFIVNTDNDEPGKKCADILLQAFEERNIPHGQLQFEPGTDANDLLNRDRETLMKLVKENETALNSESTKEIDKHRASFLLEEFQSYIDNPENCRAIQTGFKLFDTAIGGGLFPKMYVIGAKTSAGKTTFVLQMADNIAKAGTDVILFSLEMAKEDIIARSLSRESYCIEGEWNHIGSALTELELQTFNREKRSSADPMKLKLFGEAIIRYCRYADNIFIYEGKQTAQSIRTIVEKHISITGKKPVVVVDYLQILRPAEEVARATTKEQTDYNIDAFAALRRELKTPVVIISAFNRSSYNGYADNSSFKESGSIEYSADCVITLEVGADDLTENENANKKNALSAMRGTNDVRKITLTFQKNRGNRVGSRVYFNYWTRFNCFREDEQKTRNEN